MASLHLSCPRCGARVPADESRHGQCIPCPDCAAPLYVPAGTPAEATGDYQPSPDRPHGGDTPQRPEAPPTPEPSTVDSLPPGTPAPRLAPATAERGSSGPLFVVDDYEVLDELARGGMGIVYRARQVSVNRVVALKMILAGNFATPETLRRFRKEAQATGRLNHPHIVPIYDVGDYHGQPYFTMKLLERGGLHHHGARYRQEPRAAAQLILSVARAVHHAHQHGILHRDLKPSNILLDEHGQPHVTDFGLAKRFQLSGPDSEEDRPAEDGSVTASGQVVGTPEYMAPEQAAASKTLTTATDVYGLGALLYALLTGRPPARGSTFMETIRQVLDHDPPPPRSLNPAIDRDLEIICLKCLRKDPAARYGSAEELARELERWLNGEPIKARPASLRERAVKWVKRRPAVAALFVLLLLAVLVGAAAFILQYRDTLEANNEAVKENLAKAEAIQRAQAETKRANKEAKKAGEARDDAEKKAKAAKEAEAKETAAKNQAQAALEKARNTDYTNALVQVSGLVLTDPERGLAILEDPHRCPVNRRDFSWGVLYRLCQRGRVLLAGSKPEAPARGSLRWRFGLQSGQSSGIGALAVSADGYTLATHDYQGRVIIWDPATGKMRLMLPFKAPVGQLALTRDGKTLIVGPGGMPRGRQFQGDAQASGLRLWDARSGKVQLTLWKGNPGYVSALALSKDERLLAAAVNAPFGSSAVKIWDLSTGKESASLQGFAGIAEALALTPDGKTLASASKIEKKDPSDRFSRRSPTYDGKLQLWDVASGKEIRDLKFSRVVSGLCFTTDGKDLLGTSLASVHRWNVATGKEGEPLDPAGSSLTALTLSPSGHTLAAAGARGITLWDLPRGNVRIQFRRGRAPVAFLAGNTLVGSSEDGSVYSWDLNPPVERLTEKLPAQTAEAFRQHGSWTPAGWTPDGRLLVIHSHSHTIRLRDAASGKELAVFTGLRPTPPRADGRWVPLEGPPPKVRLSPDGKTAALLSDLSLRLCDIASGQERVAQEGVRDFWFSPDGKTSAAEVGKMIQPTRKYEQPRFESNGLKVWDLADGKELCTLPSARGEGVFSPDGRRLAAGGKVWEVASGREQEAVPAVGNVRLWGLAGEHRLADAVAPAAWHPTDQLLASARKDSPGVIQLWHLRGGKGPVLLAGHGGSLTALALSSNGKTLASAGEDETVRLWETATGKQRFCLESIFGQVKSLKFTVDGATLIGEAGPRQLALWDVATGRPHVFRKGAGSFSALALGPDGKTTATACGPDVHLWQGGKRTATLEGPGGPVTALAFADDGKTLTAWSTKALKRWDVATHRVREVEPIVDSRPPSLELSADGRTLYALHRGTLTLRDLRSGAARGTISHVLRSPTFSPDGSLCAVEVAGEHTGPVQVVLKVWDVARGKAVATLTGARGPALFSPDSRRLSAPTGVGVKVWEARTGKEIAALDAAEPVLFRQDGRLLLVADGNGRLLAWEPGSGKKAVPLSDAVAPVVFTTDSKVLSASAAGYAVKLWDAAAGKELATLEGHTGAITGLACSPDGKIAASQSLKDRTVRLWDLAGKGKLRNVVEKAMFWDPALTFIRDGKVLIAGSLSRWGHLEIDVATGQLRNISGGWMALSPDGKTLVPNVTHLSLVDAETGEVRALIDNDRTNDRRVWFTSDGKALVCQGRDYLELWDARTGDELAAYDLSARSSAPLAVRARTPKQPSLKPPPGAIPEGMVMITPARRRRPSTSTLEFYDPETGRKLCALGPPPLALDGSKLLALALPNSGMVQFWDVEAGVIKHTRDLGFGLNPRIMTLGFTADRKTLLALLPGSGPSGPLVARLDLATGRRRFVPLGRSSVYGPPSSVALSPDGRFVAYSSTEYPGAGQPAIQRVYVVELGGPRRATLPGGGYNSHLVFSADGQLLACRSSTFGQKSQLKVWEWATGKERMNVELPPGGPQVPLLAFSADGKRLASTFGADTVMLWDAVTGKEQAAVKGMTGPATLRPDGKAIACLDANGRLRLTEVATGKDRWSFALYYSYAARSMASSRQLSWRPDGKTLVVSGGTGEIVLWDTQSDTLRLFGTVSGQPPTCLAVAPDGRSVLLGRRSSWGLFLSLAVLVDAAGQQRAVGPWVNGEATAAAWSPDGKLLALAGSNRFWVTLWDTRTWKRHSELKGHSQGVHCVAFSPDGTRLAAGSSDGKVKIWEAASTKLLATFEVGKERVTHVAFGPDGNILAALGAGRIGARLWDVTNRKQLGAIPGDFKALALSPDGKTLALAGADAVQFFDTASGKKASRLPAAANWLWFAPDGKTLVFNRTSASAGVILWDLAAGKERAKLPVNTALIAPRVTPQGVALVTATMNQGRLELKVWDVATGAERPWKPAATLAAAPHRFPVQHAVVSPDGKVAATSCSIQVNLWDLTTRTVRATLPGSAGQLAFSPDSKRLVTVNNVSTIKVWDVSPVRLRATLEGKTAIGTVAFSPDGRFLAYLTASETGTPADAVVVADRDGRARPVTLRGHRGRVASFVFSANGLTLATRGEDGSVRLWDTRSGKERFALTGPPAPLPVLGLSPDGKSAFTISADGAGKKECTRWALATGRAEGTLAAADAEELMAEAPALVTVKREHELKLVEPDTGRPHCVLHDLIGWNNVSLHFSADGTRLATVSSKSMVFDKGRYQPLPRPQTVQVWDLGSGRLLSTIDAWVTWLPQKEAAFSPDNRLLALVGGEQLPPLAPDPKQPGRVQIPPSKELVLWDVQTGKKHAVLTHPWTVTSSAFSQDGKRLATASPDKVIRLWDVDTGQLVRALQPQPANVQVLAFLAEDKVLLLRIVQPRQVKGLFEAQDRTVLDNSDLKLWDLAADREHTPLRGSRSLVAWSPDRRTLATVRTEEEALPDNHVPRGYLIQVWDTATGHERAALAGHRTPILLLGFAADGKALVSRSNASLFRWTTAAPDLAQRHYLAGNGWLWKNHPFAPPLPDSSGLQFLRGVPSPETENLARAIASYRTAARLDARHVPARLALGRTLLELKDKFKPEARPRFQQEAVTVLGEAVQLRPGDAEAQNLLADALVWAGKDDEAIKRYREVLDRDKDQVDALAGLGAALVRRGRSDEALDVYQRRVLLAPEDGGTFLALGKLRLARHEDEKALACLRKAAALLPGTEVQLALATVFARLDLVDEAVGAYRKAAVAFGASAEMHFRLARLLERKGLLAEAVDAYRRTLARPDVGLVDWAQGNGQVHGELGRALLRNGQFVEAALELRQAQSLSAHLIVLPLPLAPWLKETERVRLLERKWPALEREGAKPADAAAALECAVLARYKQRYLASARFFREAFGKQPAWARRGVDRYNAACAAVLASAGRGKDTASLPQQERERWRKQALVWLQADLAALTRVFDGHPLTAVSEVYPTLSLWQTDPSLAIVRDRPEVARLSRAEQDAWKKFWSEVATLRRRSAAVPTGGWRIEGKELVQEQMRASPLWVMLGEPEWTDYDFEVEAQRVSGKEGFGVGFRVADRENFLLANFGGWDNSRHAAEVMTEGSVRPLWSPLQPGSIEVGRWYKVRVEVRGSRFRVLLDGKEVLSFTDTDHPRGAVGLRSWNTANRFRNLKVTDPKGKVLLDSLTDRLLPGRAEGRKGRTGHP